MKNVHELQIFHMQPNSPSHVLRENEAFKKNVFGLLKASTATINPNILWNYYFHKFSHLGKVAT